MKYMFYFIQFIRTIYKRFIIVFFIFYFCDKLSVSCLKEFGKKT